MENIYLNDHFSFRAVWILILALHLAAFGIGLKLLLGVDYYSDAKLDLLKHHKNYNKAIPHLLTSLVEISCLNTSLGILVALSSLNVRWWIFIKGLVRVYVVWLLFHVIIIALAHHTIKRSNARIKSNLLKVCAYCFFSTFFTVFKLIILPAFDKYIFLFQHLDHFKQFTIDKYREENMKMTFDFVQRTYNCCGVDGIEDWKEFRITEKTLLDTHYDIPDSCCIVASDCNTSQVG